MRMDKDICKVMFNEVELHGACKRLGEQITKDYEGKDLLIVGILNGAIVFVTDLMREIDRQINIDFMSVSSYGSGTTSSGTIHVAKDLNSDIAGRNVLIVEDILDTGNTLHQLITMLKERHSRSACCWISPRAASRRSTPIMSAIPFPMPLWSATVSITPRNTATCPTSAFFPPAFIPTNNQICPRQE